MSATNIYYVYQYIDPNSNLPFYIGKGKEGSNRHLHHLKETIEKTDNKRKVYKLQKLKSLGSEPVIQIIKSKLTEDAAYQLESSLIQKYGRKNIDPNGILTNICVDSRPPTYSGKDHWLKKNPDNHPNLGKRLSEETKRKIGDKNSVHMKGYIPWNKGIPMSSETKQNLSESLKLGYKQGRSISPSAFKKGRIPHNISGDIFYFESEFEIICTDNLTRMSKDLGINNPSGFSMLKRGKLKTYKGYKFLESPSIDQVNQSIQYLYHQDNNIEKRD